MDVTLRPPTLEEASAIAGVLNAHSQGLWGVDALNAARVEHWFSTPGISPSQDMLVAELPDGRLVGYADVSDGGPSKTRFWIDLRLLPEAGPEAGDAAVAALEARARERAAPGALARGVFAERDDLTREVFAARGYEPIRHQFHMERSLAADIDEPVWPDGIAVRTGTPDDVERLWHAVEDGFADHWEFQGESLEEFTHWLTGPDNDHDLWFLAMDGDEIAGVCLGRPHDGGDREAGYVASLSVRPPWRRRGLALALLLHSFREFRAPGRTRATLGVDAENVTGAVRLYEKAGMHAVRRYDLVDKRL